MSGRQLTVTIEGLAQSGEGTVRVDGRQVKVHGAIPGERVSLEIAGATATLLEVLTPSQDRVEPRCELFGICGGCAWQHLAPSAQRAATLDRLRRSLPPALRDVPIEQHPSPVGYHWRARARLAWQVTRGATKLGYRSHRSTDLVDVRSCPVLVETLSNALGPLRAHLATVASSGEVQLALGADAKAVASIHPGGQTASGFDLPQTLVREGFAGVALWVPGATIPVCAGDPRPRLQGADGMDIVLSIDGFGQAHATLNPTLARYVADRAEAADRRVFELHAGAGNFTVLLAAVASRVTAVESDADAVAALRLNLAARSQSNVTVRHDRAECVASDIRADVLVLDPPRTGAREVVETLSRVERIVYVSCDPPTLGRDLGILSDRYELASLATFEMFPQTPHVEAVATLTARRRVSGKRGGAFGATPHSR